MAPSTDSRTTAEVEQNHLAKEYLDDITNKLCTHRRQCKDSWKRFRQECKQKITYLPTSDDLRRFFDEQKELVTQAMSLYLYREQELEICLWHQRHMNSIPESELNWTVYQMRATVRDQREEYLEKFLSQLQRGLEVACKYNDTVESNPRFLPMHKRDFFMFWNTFIYEKKALLIHHEHAKTASKDETFLNEVRYECYHRILVNAADMLYSYDEAKAILYPKHRSIPIDPELARKPLKEAEDSWSALRIRLDALWALQSVQSDTQGPILDERFLGMVKEIKHLHLRIKKARKYLNKHSMEGYEYY